jgi:hypothetical protein
MHKVVDLEIPPGAPLMLQRLSTGDRKLTALVLNRHPYPDLHPRPANR